MHRSSLFVVSLRWLSLLLALITVVRAQSDYATPYLFTTIAGVASEGSADGTGSAARFFRPFGLAIDREDNVYVADTLNQTIRKISPAGAVTTFAGAAGRDGSAEGTGPAARFFLPMGVGYDRGAHLTGPNFNLYVADSGNHTIRAISPSGVVSTVAGSAGVSGSADGAGSAARFNYPQGLAVDLQGNVCVADTDNHTVRIVHPTPSQGVVVTLAGAPGEPGNIDATGPAARFNHPTGIAVGPLGTHFVSDSDNDSIRRISPANDVSTYATGIHSPSQLVFDPAGNLYVADAFGSTIRKFAPDGTATIVAGTPGVGGYVDGPGASARFNSPHGLALDSSGNLYVGDSLNNVVRKITPAGEVTTLAGLAPSRSTGHVDGTGPTVRFSTSTGIAPGANGEIYIADTGNGTIRKITAAGVVTTFAGTPGVEGSADGPGNVAQFRSPAGIALDAGGNLYVADNGNNTIRKITPAGIVSTLAGSAGLFGNADGTGTAARFRFPYAVAVDAAGTVFVADSGNNAIRKITPAGVVTTLASTAAAGLALDAAGNLYVTMDRSNYIRKITPGGTITTLDGLSGTNRYDFAANFLHGLAVDAAGNIYVADDYAWTIRKIATDGTVTTLAGLAGARGSADGVGDEARFNYPRGIALDSTGTLYVTDGSTIRKGVPAAAPVITVQPLSQTVDAGASVTFAVIAGGVPTPVFQWYRGNNTLSGATASSLSLAGVQSAQAGDYTVVVTNALGRVTSSKATLALNPPPPLPPSGGGPTGGGGGAVSEWFLGALLMLGATRCLRTRRP